MSFLDQPIAPIPPAQDAANQILNLAHGQFNFLTSQLANCQQFFWNNPNATPQDISNALGTNAAMVFSVAIALQTFINSLVPNTNTFTAPRSFTVNDDGTVTIGS